MKRPFFIALLSTHSLLQASDSGTLFMGTTLFTLFLTLVILLMRHLKNLQKENLRYRTFFRHAQTPAFFIDAKGKIRELNDNALKLSGYTKEQLTLRNWEEMLLSEGSARQVRQRIVDADRNDKMEFTASLHCAGGYVVEADFTLSKLPDPLRGSILSLSENVKKQHNFEPK